MVTLTQGSGEAVAMASRNVLVRARDPDGYCEPDDTILCLRDSRYSVSVEWETGDGTAGQARVTHAGTNDSGLFWFFDRVNWEILIKVLDGCAINGHVWVFAASTTDLGYLIRVTDTATGDVWERSNEPGMPAPAINDTKAFPNSCPAPTGAAASPSAEPADPRLPQVRGRHRDRPTRSAPPSARLSVRSPLPRGSPGQSQPASGPGSAPRQRRPLAAHNDEPNSASYTIRPSANAGL